MTWYAVHTKPRLEGRASYYLRRQGYRTFYPFTREKLYTGKARRMVEVDRPLFSRYIFVELRRATDNLYDVNETYGVSTVVHIGGEPLEIPEKVVTALMELTDDAGMITAKRVEDHWFKGKIGDRVEFDKSSAYYGLCAHLASIEHLDTKGEIGIFLTMFGAERSATAHVSTVAKVIAA